MEKEIILAIDQGSTSVRASLFDAHLRLLASSAETIRRMFPQAGWVEVDAQEVVAATERVVERVLTQTGLSVRKVVRLGLANQGETVVVWNRTTGVPIAPAIVWQCRRTDHRCEVLRRDGHETWVRERTGLPIDAYFSATKIAWLLEHVPGAREAALRGDLVAGTLDSFTLFQWSGGKLFVTDPSTSCRTLLTRLQTGLFDEDLCKFFDVPRKMLADVAPSDAQLGEIRIADGPVRVGAILCDQPAALLGVGCLQHGDAKCTYGTGAFLQVNTSDQFHTDANGLLRSIAWQFGSERTYLAEGSILAAGDVLTWLRDELNVLVSFDEVDSMLRQTPHSMGVAFLPALTGLGAPHWIGHARGLLAGLSRATRREHLVRAALEGIAHQVVDILDVMDTTFSLKNKPIWVDGGLAVSDAFVELQSNLADRTMRRLATQEATSRGVAAVALVQAGLADSLHALFVDDGYVTFHPSMDPQVRERARARYRTLQTFATSHSILDITSV